MVIALADLLAGLFAGFCRFLQFLQVFAVFYSFLPIFLVDRP
jgi:hypothetical protein